MSSLSSIYEPWSGNAEAMAAAIAENPITVRQWRNRGSIPTRYWRKIIAAAEAAGRTLTLDDFVPAPDVAVRPIRQPPAPLPEAAQA